MTAHLKTVPPQERLQHRRQMMVIAADLTTAADYFNEAATRWSNVIRELQGILERARTLTNHPARDQHARALDSHLKLALKLTRNLLLFRRADNRDDALQDSIHIESAISRAIAVLPSDLNPILMRALGLDQAQTILGDLNSALRGTCDFRRVHSYMNEIARHLSRADFTTALVFAEDLVTHLRSFQLGPCDYPAFVMDLEEARDQLEDAANDFAGAVLASADLAEADLIGVHWDNETQWPSPEWRARLRSASVEDPPGSGIFVVQPAGGRDRAGHDSLTPIS
ncbi:hypothetical protein [Streptomyces sp. NPDC046978]|uniref:hypothetical protein n=1 Tax=Streptomyces sp. NPDC046978 TaxID=3154704 RepID=UPI0033D1296F